MARSHKIRATIKKGRDLPVDPTSIMTNKSRPSGALIAIDMRLACSLCPDIHMCMIPKGKPESFAEVKQTRRERWISIKYDYDLSLKYDLMIALSSALRRMKLRII